MRVSLSRKVSVTVIAVLFYAGSQPAVGQGNDWFERSGLFGKQSFECPNDFLANDPFFVSPTLTQKNKIGDGWRMETFVVFGCFDSGDGALTGNTYLTNHNNAIGYHGGVLVLLVDRAGLVLYRSRTHVFAMDAAFFARKRSRNVEWEDTVPKEILPRVAYMVIAHSHISKGFDWNRLVDQIAKAGEEIGRVVSTISGRH